MKTDERMAERIAHLERDVKILKNEVRAVLVDLKDRYLAAEDPLNALPAQATSQQVVVLQTPAAQTPAAQAPAANEATSDTGLNSGPVAKEGGDRIEKPTRVSEAGRETYPETAREEVKQAQMPEDVPINTRQRRDNIPDRDINIIKIGGLVNWAEESVKKLGLQNTEAILEVADMMGLLSPQLKQIMTKLINTDTDGDSQPVSTRVFLDSLVKVTTLLGKDNQTEAALLSILSGKDDDG
jgi:hypothetical protein